MSKDEKYQGWHNHPTWALALWMDNDEGLYNMARELAQEAKDEAADKSPSTKTTRSDATIILADKFKDFWEERIPELDPPWGDLLNSAWGDVDLYEIAEHYLED